MKFINLTSTVRHGYDQGCGNEEDECSYSQRKEVYWYALQYLRLLEITRHVAYW